MDEVVEGREIRVVSGEDRTKQKRIGQIDQPGIGRFLVPGSPLEFADRSTRSVRAAPVLGEHTGEVLAEILGLSGTELGELGRQHVIGEAP